MARKMGTRMGAPPPADIDAYLAEVPAHARLTLQKLRKVIQAAAPQATERISYGMPAFYYRGPLVYFAAFKDHCSFFPGSRLLEAHRKELKSCDTSKGTIRFPIGKPLPAALVTKLVKARIAENERRARK